MHGINTIRITGRILIKSIPIGADIALVSVMTKIFIIRTIVARGKVGIKDSMESVLLEPLLVLPSVLLKALVLGFRNQGPLVRRFVLLGLLVRCSAPLEPLVLAFINLDPLVLGFINLKKLLLLRKSIRNSPPTGASSQIAQPGRSGIILHAKSRSPWFDHEIHYSKKAAISNYSGK